MAKNCQYLSFSFRRQHDLVERPPRPLELEEQLLAHLLAVILKS